MLLEEGVCYEQRILLAKDVKSGVKQVWKHYVRNNLSFVKESTLSPLWHPQFSTYLSQTFP